MQAEHTHNDSLKNSTWLIEDTTSADRRMWADWSHSDNGLDLGNGQHQSFSINIVDINTHADAGTAGRGMKGG